MSLAPTVLDERLHQYFLGMLPGRHPLFDELEAEMRTHERGRMSIAREEGVFLSWLVSTLGAKKILEVGVFTGHSSLSMALAMPEGGVLVACDVSEEYTRVAREYWQRAGVAEKIELHLAPAAETLDRLLRSGAEGTFDLAFIDADKTGYDNYYEAALRLVRRGGVIAFDNVLWNGAVADPAIADADTLALRALNDKLARDERVTVCVLPIADGVTLATRR